MDDSLLYIKFHASENGEILAMCDKDLIGKVLEDGNLFIDVKTYADFYAGDLVDKERAKEMIDEKDIYSANVIGKESIAVAVEKRLISRENVLHIKSVPYAHAYTVNTPTE